MGIDYIGHCFAAIVATIGIYGFMKAGGSVHSLSYGLIIGSLLAAGAYMNGLIPPQPLGQVIISMILVLIMGWRFCKTCNFLPGLVALIAKLIIVRAFFMYREFMPFIGTHGIEK